VTEEEDMADDVDEENEDYNGIDEDENMGILRAVDKNAETRVCRIASHD
jgi:hypothetical protein